MHKNPIQAEVSFLGDAEKVVEVLEKTDIKPLRAGHFTQAIRLTITVRYPHGSGTHDYTLPGVQNGDTHDAYRALRDLEQQSRIDPDKAQEARVLLRKLVEQVG